MENKIDSEIDWVTVATTKDIELVLAKLEEHSKTLENFRTSFRNIETLISQLKERNRLR